MKLRKLLAYLVYVVEYLNVSKGKGIGNVTPQKYLIIFIINLLYILGTNGTKLGFFQEH